MRRALAILPLLAACQFELPGGNDWFPCDAGFCDRNGNPVGQSTGGSSGAPDAGIGQMTTGQCAVNQLALDGPNAYWTTSTGDVLQAAIGAGASVKTVFSGASALGGIAIAGGHVFFADENGTVYSIDTSGQVAPLATGLDEPYAIAADGTNVYWTELGTGTARQLSWSSEGAPVNLDTGRPWLVGIAVDANNVYLASLGTCSSGVASGGGTIRAVPIGGGTPVTLADDQTFDVALCDSGPSPIIQAFGGSVYWVANGDIMQVAANGSAPAPLGVGGAGRPLALAVDQSGVYWTTGDDEVVTCGLTGGPVTVLAASQTSPGAIATNASAAVWQSEGTANACPLSFLDPK
jgi:hypothetical protein